MLRFGRVNEDMSNTNIIEHAGKYYSTAENDMPQEIDIFTLETLGPWRSILRSWNRPFSSHPKKAPGTGELVTIGFDARKPYLVLGCISADGKKLIHKVDLKLERSIICHEIGITPRLMKFEKEKYARIGVMHRYGDADSMRWFDVEPCTAFHIINCYEEADEVVVMACRAEYSIIPGPPEMGIDKYDWFSRGFKHLNNSLNNNNNNNKIDEEGFLFSRPYMWRINMESGIVENQSYLTGSEFSMDFPMINHNFTGIRNKYGYTQVVDSTASSAAGMVKYNGLAKLCLEDITLNILRENN
ncbi:hypothetical protein ABFS83_05G135600 [Erythranthe nasuta]